MGPFLPPGPPVTGIDFRIVLAELYPKLNASSAADLVYWTEAELYEWADEAAKRLARTLGVFVEEEDFTLITTGQALYTLPARHISTIHGSIAGVALQSASVQEVEALDVNWTTSSGSSHSFLNDSEGTAKTRVYPQPDASLNGAHFFLIFHRFPLAITSSNYQLVAPACLTEYFSWLMLSEARRKESDASMPEVADHYAARVDLMAKVIEAYWGDSQ